jgi:hypothetical protein
MDSLKGLRAWGSRARNEQAQPESVSTGRRRRLSAHKSQKAGISQQKRFYEMALTDFQFVRGYADAGRQSSPITNKGDNLSSYYHVSRFCNNLHIYRCNTGCGRIYDRQQYLYVNRLRLT